MAYDNQTEYSKARASAEGLTLMECVVAIAVIALTGALITPPLFVAGATRVQQRRSEQALQIAQGEVDRVRALVEQGVHTAAKIPAVSPIADLVNVPPPGAVDNRLKSSNGNCAVRYDGSTIPALTLLPIDIDADCEPDFYLQSFRTEGEDLIGPENTPPGDLRPTNFDMGVRVYSENAVQGGNVRPGIVADRPASVGLTTGSGNQRFSPLSVLYTSITWDASGDSLYCYHDPSNRDGNCLPNPSP